MLSSICQQKLWSKHFIDRMSKGSKMQQMLENLYDELSEAARLTNRIYKAAKEPQDYFTHEFKLKQEARPTFGKKYISLEQILKVWIPKWKSEGRLKYNPPTLEINEEEARIFDTKKGIVQLPQLYSLMMSLFVL